MEPDDARLDRVLTIPNVISVVRLGCLPLFLWLLFGRDDRASAAWLLAFLGTTDFLDGYIARHFDQVSNLGKILDPVADRLIFIVGGGAILVDGSVPTWFGKAGTFGLLMAFPLFLAHESSLEWWQGWAWLTGIPGLVLSLIAAVLYVPIARRALAEREGHPVEAAG